MADNTQLRPALLETGAGLFAVLDGAQFDDLPAALFEGDFVYRSLYLDRGDGTVDRLRTAPQLVWLDRDRNSKERDNASHPSSVDPEILDRLLDLLAERPAVVFWQCDIGDRLYRHLRGINKILFPRSAHTDRGKSDEPHPLSTAAGRERPASPHELLVFRHADANVMAQVLPSLSSANVARILGPADQVLFAADADWAERPMRLKRSDELLPAPSGPLKLSPREVEAIGFRRAAALRSKRIRLLRRTSPSLFDDVPDDEVMSWAEQHERSGREIGLMTERGLLQWTYLMGGSKGRFADDPHIRAHLTSGPGLPDRKLDAVMSLMVRASRESRR
ncbi:hypothetical protein [Afifella sp. YEN Y35]|uniref:hypothetical protein n=1 Tax=Afifella sp. YEN Y35 TaxID=3388337 RepID=UPI0039E07C44